MLETASAGSGATGIAEAVVATKLPNSTVVAHASISLDMCVSSLEAFALAYKVGVAFRRVSGEQLNKTSDCILILSNL